MEDERTPDQPATGNGAQEAVTVHPQEAVTVQPVAAPAENVDAPQDAAGDAPEGAPEPEASAEAPADAPEPDAAAPYPSFPGLSVDPAAPTMPSAYARWSDLASEDATTPIEAGYPAARPDAPPGAAAPEGHDPAALAPYAYGGAYPEETSAWAPTLGDRLAALADPFSRLVVALLIAGVLLAIGLAAGLGLLFTQGDWAGGARAGALAALLAAGATLLGTLGRVALGRRARQTLLLGVAFAVAFGVVGGVGLATADPLHLAQARALEAGHDWAGAVREYGLAGEHGPASRDLARTYVEWGDALLAGHDYAHAADRYATVIASYPAARPEAQRAVAGLLRADAAWLNAGSDTLPYVAVERDLATAAKAPWCDASCRAAVGGMQAQAAYQYGGLLAGAKHYDLAIKQFESVATLPTGPYTAKAHAAAAVAYFAVGQPQLAAIPVGASCPAIATYKTLATKYGDTAQGKQAASALAGGVEVSGVVAKAPTNPAPTVYLSQQVNGQSISTLSYFSDDYSAALDGSGHFVFKDVAPGKYNLSGAFADGTGTYWYSGSNAYWVVVGQLCPVSLGSITWT